MFRSIVEAVSLYAGETPDKLCVVDGNGETTYGAMWQKINVAAHVLREKGIKEQDCVVVECSQDADYLICDLACELTGAVFVPLENNAAAERFQEIAAGVSAKLYIGATDYVTEIPRLDLRKAIEEAEGRPFEDMGAEKDPDVLAEILYTTGTTGRPKGIMLSNGNNVAVAENIVYGTEMKKDTVELIPLPLSHSHGLRSCYAHLINGSTMVLTDGVMKVQEIFALMETYRVSAMDLSPSAAKILLKLSKGSFADLADKIDYIQIGTAMLGEDVKEELCRIFGQSRLYNSYGSTESGRACILDFNHMRGYNNCIGRPTRHARFIVTNEQRETIESSGENMGLIAVAGEMNMMGYWNDRTTVGVKADGQYVYTNDIGYIDADSGLVYVMGRADDVINYQGIKIAPEDIEEGVMRFPGILDCACVPLPDKLCGQVPKLFVVAKDPEGFRQKELLEFLSNILEANKMPRVIEMIEAIPRTSNGKVQRKKLIEQDKKS